MRASERPGRTILNVSSIASTNAAPSNAGYSATKAALDAWGDGLHLELEPFGIRVFAVLPGAFRTRFLSKGSIVTKQSSTPYQGNHPAAQRLAGLAAAEGKQPGDPAIAAERMVQEVSSPTLVEIKEADGTTTTRPISKLVVGDDAVPRYERSVQLLQKNIEASRARSTKTSFAK